MNSEYYKNSNTTSKRVSVLLSNLSLYIRARNATLMIVCSCIFLPASICICWPSPFSSIYVHSVLVFKQIRGYLFSNNIFFASSFSENTQPAKQIMSFQNTSCSSKNTSRRHSIRQVHSEVDFCLKSLRRICSESRTPVYIT